MLLNFIKFMDMFLGLADWYGLQIIFGLMKSINLVWTNSRVIYWETRDRQTGCKVSRLCHLLHVYGVVTIVHHSQE